MNQKQKERLEKALQHATLKGGACLSTEYFDAQTSMTWQCRNDTHETWNATYNNIVNHGRWCPTCGIESRATKHKNQDGLERAINHAKSKGGACLSNNYLSAKEKMLWKCSNANHAPWQAIFSSVVSSNRWCPACGDESVAQKLGLKDGLTQAEQHALIKGGTCWSTNYENARAPLKWSCGVIEHKEWTASFDNVVRRGHWCPECGKKHLSENKTRLIFEEFFGKPFPTTKPTWNVNPWTGWLLELDGYCKDFNVAFEHDGEHHKANESRYSKNFKESDLTYQKFKDEQKRKNCTRQGILLINVPIVRKQDRNSFEPFLENIVKACESKELTMTFSKQQLEDLKTKFIRLKM